MEKATLIDEHTKRNYDLIALVKEHGRELTIGRSADNIIVLGMDEAGNIRPREDVLKHWKQISRNHATISYDLVRNIFYIEDSSTNGTYLGKEKRRLDKGQKAILIHSHHLFFGQDYHLIFTQE